MGIERFFSSLNSNFDVIENLAPPYEKINASHFLIDFNSIIHNVSSKMLKELNDYTEGKLDSLSFHFTDMDDFEPQLIIQVKEYVKNLLKNNFISENLEYIMIAIDGVPTFAKMMEQKKRRYVGDLMTKLLKSVELPINWSKNNISPGTNFMDILCKELKKTSFIDECKEICGSNFRGVFISDVYNPGEGEMKIISCLRNLQNNENKICVYSPDSDMILLLLMLDIDTILLRYDQQNSKEVDIFNRIDIPKFKDELLNYCKSRIDNFENDRIILDEIIYIFTLFGDDFLPKLESINVSEDINSIINNYLITLIDKGHILNQEQLGGSSRKYDRNMRNLIKDEIKSYYQGTETEENDEFEVDDMKYTLNHDNLKYFFKLLSKNELQDINRNFYNSKFKNYRYANTKNFHYSLRIFKEQVDSIILKFVVKFNFLKRNQENCTPLNVSTCIDVKFFSDFMKQDLDLKFDYNKNSVSQGYKTKSNLNTDFHKGLIEKVISNENPFQGFLYNLSKIIDGYELYHTLYGDSVLSSSYLSSKNEETQEIIRNYQSLYYLKISDTELLEDLMVYFYLKPLNFPFNNFTFEIVNKKENLFKRSYNIKDHKFNLNKKSNSREYLNYLIEYKIGEYYNLFNPEHNFYKNKVTSLSNYYQMFFGDINKNLIIDKYIQGFEWVLNYYFNNKVDQLWHYPFIRTPLLSDIVKSTSEEQLELSFNDNLKFNPLESIIFISPIEPGYNLNFLPKYLSDEVKKKIQDFMNQNRQFFLPLSEINIRLNENLESLPDLLDCSVSIFLSKCHFKLLENNNDPKLFIRKFREILNEDEQPLKNVETFKCINLKLHN